MAFCVLGTSSAIFDFLRCHEFELPEEEGGGSEAFLYVDYSIDCNSKEYAAMIPFAIAMILIYPVGLPLAFGILTFTHRAILRDEDAFFDEKMNDFPNIGISSPMPQTRVLVLGTPESIRRLIYLQLLESCLRARLLSLRYLNSRMHSLLRIIHVHLSVQGAQLQQTRHGPRLPSSIFFLAALLIRLDVTSDDDDQAILEFCCLVFAGPSMSILEDSIALRRRGVETRSFHCTNRNARWILRPSEDRLITSSIERSLSRRGRELRAQVERADSLSLGSMNAKFDTTEIIVIDPTKSLGIIFDRYLYVKSRSQRDSVPRGKGLVKSAPPQFRWNLCRQQTRISSGPTTSWAMEPIPKDTCRSFISR